MTPEWLKTGSGRAPGVAWSMRTEAEVVATALARETGTTYVADASGSIYALDRKGEIQCVTRGFSGLDRLEWADDGSSGAIVTDGEQVSRLSPRLESLWSATLPGEVLSVALDPYGNHLAIGMATRKTFILNWRNKRVTEFETMRPLRFIRFAAGEPHLIGAASQGLLCRHHLSGEEVWNEQVFSNVGDLRITGNAGMILIAGFNHGVQVYDGDGSHRGAYMVEGTPKLADSTFMRDSVLVATIEKHLYWLDSDGEMHWATETDDEIIGLHCDPLGEAATVAMQSGWVHRLSWQTTPE